jgi:hypothetical protein
MFDGKAFGLEVVDAVKSHLDRALAPLIARIDSQKTELDVLREQNVALREGLDLLVARVAHLPEARNGKDADPAETARLVAEAIDAVQIDAMVAEKVRIWAASSPVPRDGKDGVGLAAARIDRDHELIVTTSNGTIHALGVVVGKDGVDGKDGLPGASGRDGIDGKDGAPGLAGASGKDGLDGKDGTDGRDGIDGKDGVPGLDGAPGRNGIDGKDGAAGRDGIDGKDADLGKVSDLIDQGFASVQAKFEALASQTKDDVKGLVEIEAGQIKAEMAGKIETRLNVLETNILTEVQTSIASFAAPKDGRDADPVEVEQLIEARMKDLRTEFVALIAEAVARAIPAPVEGKSWDPEALAPLIETAVSRAIAARPEPVSVRQAMIDRDGSLVLVLSDQTTTNLGQVVGHSVDQEAIERLVKTTIEQQPKPKDGLGFDDLEVVYDGERRMEFKLERDGHVKEFGFDLPIVIYRGIYQESRPYERGDCVTFGGSSWIAEIGNPPGKPGTEASGWRLAVKAGRPGKDVGTANNRK